MAENFEGQEKRPSLAKPLGNVVGQKRTERGLSKEKFANDAGITRKYLTEIEMGDANVTLFTQEKLAENLEMTVGELIAHAERQKERCHPGSS